MKKNLKIFGAVICALSVLLSAGSALAANYTVVKEPWIKAMTMPFVNGIATVYEDVQCVPGAEPEYFCYGNYYTVDVYGNTAEPRSDIENSLWASLNYYDWIDDGTKILDPDYLCDHLEEMGYKKEIFVPQKYTTDDEYHVMSHSRSLSLMGFGLYVETYTLNGYAIINKGETGYGDGESEYAIIDRNENIIVPFGEFDYISPYVSPEGLVWVEKDDKYGIIKLNNTDNTVNNNSKKDITVKIDGAEVAFDQPPIIVDERTLVPVRAIFENLGATVDWNGETRTVTSNRGNITISMTIDKNEMFKNGNPISLDVPPQIIGERTLVPARAIAESFNCDVDWDGETRTVIITTK